MFIAARRLQVIGQVLEDQADSAPLDASVISVSVFHPFLGPALTAMIFLLIIPSFPETL